MGALIPDQVADRISTKGPGPEDQRLALCLEDRQEGLHQLPCLSRRSDRQPAREVAVHIDAIAFADPQNEPVELGPGAKRSADGRSEKVARTAAIAPEVPLDYVVNEEVIGDGEDPEAMELRCLKDMRVE